MSDDETTTDPASKLEIHINLKHPALRGRKGLDAVRVYRLLKVVSETIGTTLQAGDVCKGCVLDGENETPLAYWVPHYTETTTTEED